VADSGEHVNELSGSMKGRGFLDQRSDHQLLKNHSVRRSCLLQLLISIEGLCRFGRQYFASSRLVTAAL
jgi:hypothetical protein